MKSHVVVSDFPMIDPETMRSVLDGVADVTVADLEGGDAVVDACRAADADAVVTDVATAVPADVFDQLDLSVVGRASVGYETIDVDAARAAGVPVVNAPDYCTDEVATHSVSLLLACVRAIPAYDRAVRAGGWPSSPGRDLHRLSGGTVGLVSMGGIARGIADRLAGFDLDLVGFDPYVDAEAMAAHGVERVDFDALLDRSRYVVVTAPETPDTRDLFDAAAFDALPEGAVFVNTGRGGVVDEGALVDALESGQVASAGLDVLREEPPGADHPLVGRDDVVVTPHGGWCSVEARRELNETVARDVRRALLGEPLENSINGQWKH